MALARDFLEQEDAAIKCAGDKDLWPAAVSNGKPVQSVNQRITDAANQQHRQVGGHTATT